MNPFAKGLFSLLCAFVFFWHTVAIIPNTVEKFGEDFRTGDWKNKILFIIILGARLLFAAMFAAGIILPWIQD